MEVNKHVYSPNNNFPQLGHLIDSFSKVLHHQSQLKGVEFLVVLRGILVRGFR